MNNRTQQFLKTLKSISLTESERLDMRTHLEAYIDFHSVPVMDAGATTPRIRRLRLSNLWRLKLVQGMAAFVLVILVGGSTCLAAERSAPGDALYAIKVNVNEPIRSTLAFSPAAKATVSAEFVQRRLEEASKLLAEKKLTPENSASLATQLQADVAKSEDAAGALEMAGDHEAALEVRSDLESRLVAHTQVMRLLANQGGVQENAPVSDFLGVVASTTHAVAFARKHSEASVAASTRTERETINASSKQALREAAQNIENLSDNSSSTPLITEARASVEIGEQALAQAENNHNTTVSARTYILSQYAKRLTKETSAVLEAAQSLDITSDDVTATDSMKNVKKDRYKGDNQSQPAATTTPSMDLGGDDL